MSTYIGRANGPVHTGKGDVVVNGETVGTAGGNGETVEVRDDGSVWVDGVRQD